MPHMTKHFVSDRDKPIGIEVRGGFPSGGINKLHALTSVRGDASRLWHFRFGHVDADAFRRTFTQQMVDGLPDVKPPKGRCIPCIRRKQHREVFPETASRRATVPLELVHIDLCGPMSIDSLDGSKYFMLIVDDYSRYMWVYFLTHKSETLFNVHLREITCTERVRTQVEGSQIRSWLRVHFELFCGLLLRLRHSSRVGECWYSVGEWSGGTDE